MLIYRNRASAILYEFLMSNFDKIDKVILPANTCEMVPLVYLKASIEIEFVDMSLETYCMDLEILEKKISQEKNKKIAIHYVRNYGSKWKNDDMKIYELKKKFPSIIFIDDRCLCKPELVKKQDISALELYSTGYAKYIDLNGGGFAFISEEMNYNSTPIEYLDKHWKKINELIKKSKINNIPFKPNYSQLAWLKIEKLSDIGSYLRKMFLEMEKMEIHKKNLNKIYSENLPKSIQLNDNLNEWRFNILVNDNDTLIKKLYSKKLFASKHYQSLGNGFFTKKIFNSICSISKNIVNLFNDKYYTDKMAFKTAEIINEYLENS